MPLALRQHVQMMPRRFDVSWRKPDSSCVLLLPGADQMDYGATIYDRSGNGNHGTISGATWTKLNSGLWALDFDGISNKITITNLPSLDPSANFAVEGWINADTWGEGNNGRIFDKGNDLWSIRIGTNVEQTFGIYGNSGSLNLNFDNGLMSLATWVYFVIIKNSGVGFDLYTQGIYRDSIDYVTAFTNNAKNIVLGYRQDDNARWFDGKFALQRFYSTAPSAAIIASHFQQERHLFGV